MRFSLIDELVRNSSTIIKNLLRFLDNFCVPSIGELVQNSCTIIEKISRFSENSGVYSIDELVP